MTRLVNLFVLFAAAACNVGPDFARPNVAVNPSWSGQDDPRFAPGPDVDPAWWKAFADPTLDELVELAYRQNLPLQIAGLRILEARAQLGIAVGEQFPVNIGPIASTGVTRLSEHAANGANLDHFFGELQLGFDAIWEVDLWGKYRRGVRSAKAGYFATVADYDGAIVALTAEVARSYVALRTFEALLDLARRNVTLQEQALDIAESRFRNGATSELDVTQAKNLLETTRTTIPKLDSSRQQAENALSTLLGRNPGAVRPTLARSTGIPAPPRSVHVGIPASLLRRRPDIRSAELRAAAQCERIGMTKAELYPSFVLRGSIGVGTSQGGGALSGFSSFKDLFNPGSVAASAGAGIFWPILRYPRILNAVRVEDARFQETLVAYVQSVIDAAREVEDGMTGYLREREAAVFAERAVAPAEQSVRLALVQYREGAVDFQRVLDSQRVLLESDNALVSTRSAALTSLIALYKALGGGWELRRDDPVVNDANRREMEQRTNWGGDPSRR